MSCLCERRPANPLQIPGSLNGSILAPEAFTCSSRRQRVEQGGIDAAHWCATRTLVRLSEQLGQPDDVEGVGDLVPRSRTHRGRPRAERLRIEQPDPGVGEQTQVRLPRRVAQSLSLTIGTTTIGMPWPRDSARVLATYVSATPAASLLTVLKVAGQTSTTSDGPALGSSAERCTKRTGAPATASSARWSTHPSAASVTATRSANPTPVRAAARSVARRATGAPHTTSRQVRSTRVSEADRLGWPGPQACCCRRAAHEPASRE